MDKSSNGASPAARVAQAALYVLHVLLFVLIIPIGAAVKESGSYQRAETVNATAFEYKLFFDNGQAFKEFLVAGKPVDQAIYEQQKIGAQQQELDGAYQKIRDSFSLFEREWCQLRAQGYLKLIRRLRDDIATLIRRLYEQRLEPFFVYRADTIGSAMFLDRVRQQLMPALGFCDSADSTYQDSDVLKRLAGLLNELYEHLLAFYTQTVRAALDQSSDAKELQRLLDSL